MCKGGGTTTITGANITTTAAGANGVFSYGGNASTNATSGDGTTVVISDSTIKTTGNGSGGIMTTGQGATKASNLTIETAGDSSAAIRSDRGGGTVDVDGGTYTTSGVGSPAIYATATINVSDATLTSTASQGVVNEGGNTVILDNCMVNAGNASLGSQDYFRNGIFLYQSMSGDATDGASVFTMTDGAINNTYGHVFHVTNTSAAITLENVAINNSDSEGVFLSVCDDAWSGLSNVATLNATDQAIDGDILVGGDSTANINLLGASTWSGSTSGSITSHRTSSTVSSSLGTVNVTLGSGSVWVLDGDCEVTSLSGTGSINYNGHTLKVGSKTYSSGDIGTVTETTQSAASEGDAAESGNMPTDSEEATTGNDDAASGAEGNTGTEDASGNDDAAGTGDSAGTDTTPSESDGQQSTGDDASQETVTSKTANTATFSTTVKNVKAKALARAAKTVKCITVKNAKGTVTYTKKSGSKRLTVDKATGKITVKKGTSAGTYKAKVKVKVSGDETYSSKAKVIQVKVKVK